MLTLPFVLYTRQTRKEDALSSQNPATLITPPPLSPLGRVSPGGPRSPSEAIGYGTLEYYIDAKLVIRWRNNTF